VSSNKSTTTATELLSAPATLGLLERLRTKLRDVITSANDHERDFNSRLAKIRAQHEQTVERERERATAGLAEAETTANSARDRADAIFMSRRGRIGRAVQSAVQQKQAEIDAEEKRRTIEIQHELLEADQTRDAGIKAAGETLQAFTALLSRELEVLQQAELRARSTLGAYGSLRRLITHPTDSKPDTAAHENQLIEKLRERLATTDRELARCRNLVLPAVFRVLPLWLGVLLVLGLPFAFFPALRKLDFAAVPPNVWAILGGGLAGLVVLYFLGRKLAAPAARAGAVALDEARKLYDACAAKAPASHAAELERLRVAHSTTTQALNANWRQVQAEARNLRKDWQERIAQQADKLHNINQERRRQRLLRAEETQKAARSRVTGDTLNHKQQFDAAQNETLTKLEAARRTAKQAIESDWQNGVVPLWTQLQAAGAAAGGCFAPWRRDDWQTLQLPQEFAQAARFAELHVDLEKLSGVKLDHPELKPAGDQQFTVPLLVAVPDAGSLLFETKNSGHEQIIGALNSLILRLLTVAPPGKVAFTIFDPVGLGQNFAGIMHLADFEERVINSRIWTQQAQFEERLAELNEHIEKVTQMYLRNEFATLAEYNAQAGRLAEKYHFLVIADFPVNFSDVAVKRLQNIIASGPRCGVHTLIHWDQRRQPPLELVPEEVRKNAIGIVPKGEGFATAGMNWEGVKLVLDAPPDAELATDLLQKIGKASTDSYRVEMPFSEVVPAESEAWSLDTTRELKVPIGRTGATKLQYLALGQGTRQHGLVAGKTGSGKSTLFHVIITNLSLWCSPDQVEFYLVDFKKGVEFKTYATHKLPHARVIAIESDREFGLSVLQRVDDELKRRGDLFRKLGAQDLAGYKRAGGNEAMPRVLLLIDEFQELFVEDDRVSQAAALLLDRIVRQGRAFGIHVLLGSQTLGGAYTLARATIGQMVVRIALQCNEADAYLIMSEDNPAPRLLSRPGEAIYNDDGGAIQGNSPFQIVWLPDQERDAWLAKAAGRRLPTQGAVPEAGAPREPIVFVGNAPANVRDNPVLRGLLNSGSIARTKSPRIWLGAPNSIKGPTEAAFTRQSGNHLLVVGQREEAALAMLVTAQIALAAQHPKDAVRVFVFDCSPPDSAEARSLQHVARAIPGGVRVVSTAETPEVIGEIAAELDRRNENPGGEVPAMFLLVHGLQQHKKLRFDEEASFSLDPAATAGNPGLLFNKLVTEGASQGIHVIATCDTYNNVMRMLSRKALSEFEMRVVFQMSANDSASLIESPAANNLGLHRAILHNGQQGWVETFRPYALPEERWLVEAGEKLAKLRG
jgi:hypothetical protein